MATKNAIAGFMHETQEAQAGRALAMCPFRNRTCDVRCAR